MVNSKDSKKTGVSIEAFANQIGKKAERLLDQLIEAGVKKTKITDLISEEEKQKLLTYLQQHHGAKERVAPIVLHRTKIRAIQLRGSRGTHHNTDKTFVQVKQKRTYVQRSLTEKEEKPENKLLIDTPPISATSVSLDVVPQPAAVEVPSVEPAIAVITETSPAASEIPLSNEEKAAETAKSHLKRKEKQRIDEPAESENERTARKKKKMRDSSRADQKNFEALLARGADLSRVLKQEDEEIIEVDLKKNPKNRFGVSAKIKTQSFTKPTAPMIHEVAIPFSITVGELAQRMSIKAAAVIKTLLKMDVVANINQSIDQEIAALVVEELGHRAKLVSKDALEEALAKSVEIAGDAQHRPPVITIMGHVDHGKTTLLDYIRTTKVAASEAGGITQHIGAYHVQTLKGTITFLDTPGHAAFTAMRARGAKLTDIVILVVAVDDGVMPQTIEAIQHAKAANVPIVVAVNKMDKPNVDPEKIKTELSRYELVTEEWGGDVMFVPISAKTGLGVDNLLDSVLVQAEVLDLKGVVDCPARGVVIESRLDHGRGSVMSVLVQQGTLRKGDIMLAGLEYGRIRALFDENGHAIPSAGPSIPVEVLGLSGSMQAGDDFIVVANEKRAREVALFRQTKHRETKLARSAPNLADFMQRIETEKTAVINLNVLIKADVLGSVEALKQALTELSNPEVTVTVISSGIGAINESDVNLAIASKAIIFAFNVRANAEAKKLMETNSVDVHYHNIIYDVINQVKKAINGVLQPIIQEHTLGMAQVRDVFRSSKTGAIAGCMVTEGTLRRNLPARILRDNVVIFESTIESLRRFKEDVGEVRNGMECGVGIKNYSDIKVGDQIEAFERIEIKREI